MLVTPPPMLLNPPPLARAQLRCYSPQSNMVFICTLNEFITVPGILILVLIIMGHSNTNINVSHHCRTQHNACRPFFLKPTIPSRPPMAGRESMPVLVGFRTTLLS